MDGSFLDLYEFVPFRLAVNDAFVLGVPFVEQIKAEAIKISLLHDYRDILVPRISEFMHVVAGLERVEESGI